MPEQLTRAFICIDFPDEVIKEIARLYENIENLSFTGKITELENLHLTLKFLGELDAQTLKATIENVKNIKMKKIDASLGEIGIFFVGSRHEPKIVWIKINGKDVWTLQEKIDQSLRELFKKDENFNAHMTLARIKYTKDKNYFEKYLKNISVKKIKFEINSFKIKSSELRPNGPVYRDIEKIDLI